MDIVRLPVAPPRPAGSSARQVQQPHAVQGCGRPGVSGARAHAPGAPERIVQGELLEREGTTRYQSTRAFIVERSVEGAQPAERQPVTLYQTRPAIACYLNHSRSESVPELTRGRSVDLVV